MPLNPLYIGDTINNFGKHLPVPYIERIELRDVFDEELEEVQESFDISSEQAVSKVTIVTSLLMHTDDSFRLNDFIDNLFSDLNLNFLMVGDEENINLLRNDRAELKGIIENMSTPSDDETTEDGDAAETADADSPYGTVFGENQLQSMPLSDYSADIAFTGEYDENTNMILKSSSIIYEMYVPAIKDLTDLTVFVGVSLGNPGALFHMQDVVFALSFGDLAYESIKIKNSLNTKNKVGFFQIDNNAYYTGTPMLSTFGKYHKSDHFDQDNIHNTLEILRKQYENQLPGAPNLRTIFDGLDTIWADYGDTPQYLMQLNRYRRNMQNQDEATPAGKFYARYSIMINNINSKLVEAPQVVKRITHSSKIRDFRPAQWTPSVEATYTEDLRDDDFLYDVILNTNLAKYVSAHEDTGEHTLFQPEAPYTPGEMKDSYVAAITEILKRFSGDFTQNRITRAGVVEIGVGMDNISQWLDWDLTSEVNGLKGNIQNAIGRFISWATGRSWNSTTKTLGSSDSRRIYAGGYWRGDLDESSHDALTTGQIAVLNSEYGGASSTVVSDDHNWKPFNSAQKLFGHKGNPANCTLEFGTDNKQTGPASWLCNNMTQTIGNPDADGGEASANMSRPEYSQYKCFNQKVPLINVLGYGDRNNTDDSGNRWGHYLVVRDKSTQSGAAWNLRTVNELADKIMDFMYDEEELFGSAAGTVFNNIVASVDCLYSKVDYNGCKWIHMVQEQSEWDNLAAEYELFNSSGELRTGKVNAFANAYVQEWEDWLYLLLDTLAYDISTTYRLRWCPCTDATYYNTYDDHSDNGNDPYGGRWHWLHAGRNKTNPIGRPYTSLNERQNMPYYYDGGMGNNEYARDVTEFRASHGVGRYAFNPGHRIVERVKEVWQSYWKQDVKDAVKDIVPLLAEYHGLNVGKADHRRMAHMDIVVQKYGWFFFDLEKFINKRSVLSRYMNPIVFQKYFEWGRDMINYTIRIDEVQFERWNAILNDDGQWRSFIQNDWASTTRSSVGKLVMNLNPNADYNKQPTNMVSLSFDGTTHPGGVETGGVPYARIKAMDVAGWRDISMEKEDGENVFIDADSGERISSYQQWSYLMQRNYDFAYDDKVPNSYRMACFAYNYYVDDDVAINAPDAIHAHVVLRDRSDRIITSLKNHMKSINNKFQEYVEAASENCAYNTFDSQFNQFFINHMDDLYGDELSTAPWLRAAAAYVIFDDLFYGRYGAEPLIVIDAARAIADRINPYTGDLEAVLEYGDKMNQMVEQMEDIYAEMQDECFEDDERVFKVQRFNLGAYSGTAFGTIGGDEHVVINTGIIDFAADRTDEFPELPEVDMSQP